MRKRMGMQASRKLFSRTANKPLKVNYSTRISRGGIRL